MFGRKGKAAPAPGPAAGGDGVRITDAGPCQKHLRLRVSTALLAPLRAAVVGEFQREATLPGFRKGRAPVALIEQRFAQDIRQETLQRATRRAIEEAAKTHGLKPVGPFELRTADFEEAQGLALEATVEVEPEFPLADYKAIPLARPSAEVGAEEVARALTQLQESMAQLVPVPPPAGQTASAPQTAGASAQGAEAKQRQVPALDDELAKDLGFETLAKLRQHVEAKLREQKRAQQQRALEQGLVEVLVSRHAFTVPAGLVAHQHERLTRDFRVRLLLSGVSEEQVDAEAGKFTEQLRGNAERLVKLGFILDRIADAEQLRVTDQEVVRRLWDLSQRWRKDPAAVRKILDDQGLWPSVISTIRQEKTMTRVMAAATITDAPATPPPARPEQGPGRADATTTHADSGR